jgi:dihydropyrimidinase
MTILIRGGGVVNHDHSRRADVLLHEGAIAVIGVNLEAPAGAETIDAGGCYVMPGCLRCRRVALVVMVRVPFLPTFW